jgi:hypothetical protein
MAHLPLIFNDGFIVTPEQKPINYLRGNNDEHSRERLNHNYEGGRNHEVSVLARRSELPHVGVAISF